MSTPQTLEVPDGVDRTTIETPRGSFAAHVVRVEVPRAHVLLVPGWTGSKEDFTQVLPLVAAAGFDVTAYDQRGQYETPGSSDADYSLDGFGADAVAVARSASDAPSHLLGHSFGGLVAQSAVIADVAAWRSLSLLCTGPAALGSSPARPLDRMVAAIDAGVPLAEVQNAVRGAGFGTEPADIEAFLAERFTRNDRTSLREITQHLIDAPDRLDQVAASGLPVWVGRGERDDAWPYAVQESMAERLGTTVRLIDAEHSPGVQNPQGLADAWLPFLTSH